MAVVHRGIDWGASAEHPFAATFGCYDGVGDWLVYDEIWCNAQDRITQDHAVEVLARSMAWGWPAPLWWRCPSGDCQAFVTAVKQRVAELCPGGRPAPHGGRTYGDTYADPSRPGEINAFNVFGIPTSPAVNEVYKGIDTIRSKLKINPITGKPTLLVHRRCKHLIEEMRKYRWLKGRKPSETSLLLNPQALPLSRIDRCLLR